MQVNRRLTVLLVLSGIIGCVSRKDVPVRGVWTKEQARAWHETKGWLRGCDFIPSTAINQLEMWQAETFDTSTIDRELGWAESIGLNAMRVYLHHAAWETDPEGFKERMDRYLSIADRHGIGTFFVLFDDCWNPVYKTGNQPAPKPGVHNSGWVRDPGDLIFSDQNLMKTLEKYVGDVLTRFAGDKRIVLWDLYNEPGNSGYGSRSLPLLKNAFLWARRVNPSQPLSAGVWNRSLSDLNAFQLANSDVITYHNYQNDTLHRECIDTLRRTGRPLLCTEYMARKHNSRFGNIMPMLKRENIAAINWGLVEGKTNTKYAWDEPIADGSEPKVWFHEIFRKDGTPYLAEEVKLIRSLTGK